MLWLVPWLVSVCLSWLFLGIFTIIGLYAMLVILPAVFYQSVLSGTMIPLTAAPEWLELVGTWIPFDSIGKAYRAIIFESAGRLPYLWLSGAAFIGLLLNWGSDIFRGRMKRRW